MPRDYGKITTSIWGSKKFTSLGDDLHAKLLYFHIHTCQSVNSLGCFRVPVGYVAADLGWSECEVVEGINRLCDAYLIEWNKVEQVIRIVGFLDHDGPTNPKHAFSIFKIANGVPDCAEKLRSLQDLAKTKFGPKVPELQAEIDRLRIAYPEMECPYPYPLPNPIPSPGPSAVASDPREIGFEEFWKEVPKKTGKGATRVSYFAALGKTASDILLTAMRAYAAARRGQPERFTLSPERWLDGEHWLDGTGQPPSGEPTDDEIETLRSHWGGEAAPLVEAIGPANFRAFFADAKFERADDGVHIGFKNRAFPDLVQRKFSASLKRVFNDQLTLGTAA